MNDIFRMIYQQFAAYQAPGDPHTLLRGRLYRAIAPPNTPAPYAVMSLVGGSIDWMFGTSGLERARIQFDIRANIERSGVATTPAEIWQGLVRVLEFRKLRTLDGSQFIVMRREGMPTELIEEPFVRLTGDWWLERQVASTLPQ